jgi:hypothetical protein
VFRHLLIALFTILLAVPAGAVVLDWNSVDWPFTSPSTRTFSQGFDIDPANPGNDITITISGDTDDITNDSTPATGWMGGPIVPSVDDHNGAAGGFGSQEGLYLFVNFDDNTVNSSLTITITFNYTYGVSGVTFPITDIDTSGSYVDQVRNFSGTYYGSPAANATLTALSGSTVNVGINNSGTASANAVGTGTTEDILEDFSNVGVSFGATPVTQVSFVWGSGPGAPGNPGNQLISLYDITYTPAVPEPSTFIASALLLAVCIAGHRIQKGKRQAQILSEPRNPRTA